METRVAKELLHIRRWLEIAASIVAKGKAAYDSDEVAQEAGDSLMIKIGEAAKTLAARGLEAPGGMSWSDAARNREKLAVSLPLWEQALGPLFSEAAAALDGDTQ